MDTPPEFSIRAWDGAYGSSRARISAESARPFPRWIRPGTRICGAELGLPARMLLNLTPTASKSCEYWPDRWLTKWPRARHSQLRRDSSPATRRLTQMRRVGCYAE